jgi:hypothetical protein
MNEIRIWGIAAMMQGKTNVLRKKICFSATFSTINPIWTGLGSNPGFHIERLESNCLIHDTSLSTNILLWSQNGNEGKTVA